MFRDLDSSVLYRVGETRGGAATYTPRMAFFERRGAMGGASAAGHLYGDASGTDGNQIPPILTWDGATKVIEQPEEGKSRFVAQLEAYDDDSDDDDDDDECLDSDDDDDDDRGPLALAEDDADVSVSKSFSDPVEALRARMAGHILRADADDRAPRAENLGEILREGLAKKNARDAPRLAEERRRAREEKARRADEANAKLVEFAKTLESESRTWTDFSKASFHSRSAFLLDGVWSGGTRSAGSARASRGPTRDRREDLRDVARRWAEECDRMQGFQVFAEDLGGFGGLAAATLEELKDEYPRQPAWLFSLRPPLPSSREAREEEADRLERRRRRRGGAVLPAERRAGDRDARAAVRRIRAFGCGNGGGLEGDRRASPRVLRGGRAEQVPRERARRRLADVAGTSCARARAHPRARRARPSRRRAPPLRARGWSVRPRVVRDRPRARRERAPGKRRRRSGAGLGERRGDERGGGGGASPGSGGADAALRGAHARRARG